MIWRSLPDRRLPRPQRALLFVFAIAALACSDSQTTPAADADAHPARPAIRNVVLVSLDALGALHSSAYGYARPTTPTLDALAAQGTLFEYAYTQQVWTLTSHLTMLTGLYPQSHGASHLRAASRGVTTLAEVLGESGFTTAAFTGIGGYMRPEFGLGRGFDIYEVGHPHRMIGDNGDRMLWIEQQAQLRERHADGRMFLFVHSYEIHSDVGTAVPYASPMRYLTSFLEPGHGWTRRGDTSLLQQMQVSGDVTEFDKQILTSLYDAGVLFADQEVLAPLVERLKSSGLWDETLFIVTADHGEELFEHGFSSHQQPYEETARVPLIFVGPGIPAGLRVEQPVELVDLMPTILSLLELPIPAGTQGVDLSPLLRGETIDKPTVFVDGLMGGVPGTRVRLPSNTIAVIDGVRWSYIAQVDPGVRGAIDFQIPGDAELYRLSDDPGQQRNVIADHPEIAALLRTRLLEWYARNRVVQLTLQGDEADAPPILSESEVEALEALGYLEDDTP